jgi:hypothetical protein
MSGNKEQQIVIFLELSESDKTLIQYGIKVAGIFKKELCLVYNQVKTNKQTDTAVQDKLNEYKHFVKAEAPKISVSVLITNEKWSFLPDILADDFEAIFLIANGLNFKKYSKALSECSIPMLFVRPYSEIMAFNRLVQTVDLRKETSDSALWCSYFGRFNKAEIVSIAAKHRFKLEKQKVARNVKLCTKLNRKFDVKHTVYRGQKSSLGNAFEALEFALASDCNLLVILASSNITPLDYLIGLPENKIIKRAGNLPVLVINPRKDNYILCD